MRSAVVACFIWQGDNYHRLNGTCDPRCFKFPSADQAFRSDLEVIQPKTVSIISWALSNLIYCYNRRSIWIFIDCFKAILTGHNRIGFVLNQTLLSCSYRPHSTHTHKDLFLLMPQKILSQPRTWGTRFDSFISSEASPTLPQPTETNNAPDVVTAEHVPDDPPKPTDQRMPHDASIFVGRYFIVTSSLRFFLLRII